MATSERTYTDEEVEKRLEKELPQWRTRERLDPAEIQDP